MKKRCDVDGGRGPFGEGGGHDYSGVTTTVALQQADDERGQTHVAVLLRVREVPRQEARAVRRQGRGHADAPEPHDDVDRGVAILHRAVQEDRGVAAEVVGQHL